MASTLRPSLWFPSRGLNTAQPPHTISMNMASAGLDVIVEENTVLKPRPGYADVNGTAVSASPTLHSFGSLYLSSGTSYELIGTSNGGIWSDESGTVTASIFDGLSTTQGFDFTQFLDTVIILDGTNIPQTWTGTATGTISAAATAAKYGDTHLEKFFISGISANRSRVDYSQTGDFNTWTGAGTDQFNVAQNNGQIITGIKSFARNELVIFKERSMYKLIGYDKPSFNLVTVDKTIGCIDNRSIQNYKSSTSGGLMMFAFRDGIYAYDGNTPRKITSYIQDFWDSVNKTRFQWVDSTLDVERGRYLLTVSVGSGVLNTRIIVVDLLHPWEDENGLHFPIWIWRVSAQALHTEIVSSTNAERLVIGGSADGKKSNFDTAFRADDGVAVSSEVETGLMDFRDSIGREQCLRRMYSALEATTGNIKVATEVKDGDDWVCQETIESSGDADSIGVDFQIGVSAIGLPEATFTARTNIKARSRRIKVRYKQVSATRTFALQSPVEFYTKPGGMRA